VEVFLIDANGGDTREAVLAATKQASIDLPVLLDETQLIGESLALANNGEVLVINPKDWKLAYRGSAVTQAQPLMKCSPAWLSRMQAPKSKAAQLHYPP